ncbi:MAG TPA: hypothetical protein VGF82_25955 [Terracidiphilus sp.]|jgi:hypothetical protein
MTNDHVKALCLALMKADTENEVIALVAGAGFWDDTTLWRYYGDYENNFNTIGNQQSRPDAALVEKLVNSEDARLTNECLARGINPELSNAPQTIRQAVAAFFEDTAKQHSSLAGRVSNWSDSKRTEIARGITLAATGYPPREGKPCFTISDRGEGQTPNAMPDTLLSLNKSNKLRIPFVQGKFNMGGTGVLKFCGRHNLQLIVTRRNPAILNGKLSDTSDNQWGFTVVRREDPNDGRRSSVYTYLAPVGATDKPRQGNVLRFSEASMPIFPDGRNAYAMQSQWGTLIKLYEYAAAGYSNTHILRKDGLLGRVDLLLCDPALPIRLHECRSAFKGHEGSFETTLTGLAVRLDDDKADNLEENFPSSCPLSVDGETMVATIYAFKKGKAETYRKNEGIVFTVNGQTHGHLTKDFFNRKNAGRLNYIADSLLVTVDCSNISGRAREDLFMNSRDRLSHNPIRYAVEDQLEEMLKQHQGLRALKEKRRSEEIQSRLADEKPLEDILKSLLEHSPTLSALFLHGQRAVNPFKTLQVTQEETEFHGKKHPTYFKFKGKEYGKELRRDCHINQRGRIVFETDADNDYFSRNVDAGEFSLFLVSEAGRSPVSDYVGPNLQNGIATLTIQLPANCKVGDLLRFHAVVSDPTLLNAFTNTFTLDIKPEAVPHTSDGGERHQPPTKEKGQEREVPTGINLPNIILVHEKDWESHTPPFDKYTALRIGISDVPTSGQVEAGNGETQDVYDFLINMDNLFLKSELKSGGQEIEMIRARWKYGLVLVGLALLHDENQAKRTKTESEDGGQDEENGESVVEKRVERFTRAIAPILLPMINSLGALELEEAMAVTVSGEAT